jgi:hypothetical protein
MPPEKATGRVCDPVLFARTVVLTNGQYRHPVAEQTAAVSSEVDIILNRSVATLGPAIAASSATAANRRKAGCKAR